MNRRTSDMYYDNVYNLYVKLAFLIRVNINVTMSLLYIIHDLYY